MHTKNTKGFTLVELIVVIIVVGVIAGLAIPRYSRGIEQSYENDATLQLKAIHSTNKIRFIRTGQYWPVNQVNMDLGEINNNLGLSIIANNVTYECDGVVSGLEYTCTAVRNGALGTFTLTLTESDLSATNPVCTGSCP